MLLYKYDNLVISVTLIFWEEYFMDNDINNYEHNLKYLCLEMIGLLTKLKKNGLLDEKEYKQQVASKIDFLKNIK